MSLSPDTGGTGDIPGAASQIRRNDPLLPILQLPQTALTQSDLDLPV